MTEADAAAATTTTAATSAAATTTAATPWFQGKLEGELLGHAQNHGWDKKDAVEAAVAAITAHREARSFIGLPEKQLVKVPADFETNTDARRQVFQKLGAPADAKGYDFTTIKRADGKELEQPLADMIRKTAFDAALPKDAATQVAKSVTKYLDDQRTEQAAVATAKLAEERGALDKNWGKNKDANLFIAKQAAQKLGIDPAAVEALEKLDKVGYAPVMEMFLKLGIKMGEDKYVAGSAAGTGLMSQEQARARLTELEGDKDFGKRLNAGDVAAVREWKAAMLIAHGESAQAA